MNDETLTREDIDTLVEKMLVEEPAIWKSECEFWDQISKEFTQLPESQKRPAFIGLVLNSPALDDIPVWVLDKVGRELG